VAYLDELDSKSFTAQINAALDLIGEDEDTQLVVEASKRRLRDLDDEW
jgi:hypothetical protein